jgi:antitoxin component YwqK of YwqJK toxin-antitoxin module
VSVTLRFQTKSSAQTLYPRTATKKKLIDNGKREYWPDEDYTGLWEVYWPNGVIKFRGNFVNGKEEGECLCFWDNGNLAQRGTKVNGECVGVWTDYSYDGAMTLEGEYGESGQHGLWKSFWHDGIVMTEEEYVDGLLHGSVRHFSFDGQLVHQGEFRNGEPYNGICHTPAFDRHPHYTMIAQYMEGEMIRELPYESSLGTHHTEDESIH